MSAEPTVQQLALLIPITAVAGAFTVAIVGVVAGSVRRAVETRAREESRREIAAYVAEGTITPDDAAKLLDAGKKKSDLAQFLRDPMRART